MSRLRVGAAGPVADFVPVESSLGEQRVRHLVHVGVGVVVDGVKFATADSPFESRALFDNERIGRDMVGLKRDGGGKTSSPFVQSFAWRSIDEIHRGLQPRLLCPRDGGADRRGLVGAVENRENTGNRRLHSDRNSGDARVCECAQGLAGHRVRIRLDGDLRTGSYSKGRPDRVEDPSDVTLGQERRGASPDEHGRGWPAR